MPQSDLNNPSGPAARRTEQVHTGPERSAPTADSGCGQAGPLGFEPTGGRELNSAIPEKTVAADWFLGKVSCGTALVVLLAIFSMRFVIFETRWFNLDEFEHLHAAWCMAMGRVPYRDHLYRYELSQDKNRTGIALTWP